MNNEEMNHAERKVTELEAESPEKENFRTMPGERQKHLEQSGKEALKGPFEEEMFKTMAGERDRKPTGRFRVGAVILGRYKVLSELGQGGMGVVYKCFDEVSGVAVALKALPPELCHNSGEMEEVRNNFQLVERLHHPNIANLKTLEKDKTEGDYYLIMEAVAGKDLRRWMRQKREKGELTFKEILSILGKVALALDHAHMQRIIHRDIKPENIMVTQEGEVKVLDFGLAAQIHTSMTRVSMMYKGTSGTAPYMSPEQLRGQPQGASADLYALAVVAFEMISGHLPYENPDTNILRGAVLNEPIPEVEGVPIHVQNALKRALAKEACDRYKNCMDFVRSLNGEKVKEWGNPSAATLSSSRGKGKLLVGVLTVVILFCMLLGGYTLKQANDQKKIQQAELQKKDQIVNYLFAVKDSMYNGDWYSALSNIELLLKVDPAHASAIQLKAEVQKKIQMQHLLSEAQKAKEAKDWSAVVGKTDAILVEDPAHSEAMLLKKEAQKKIQIQHLLSEAQKAKEARDWSVVVGKTDAILVEDPAHSEAMLLKEEAQKKIQIQHLLSEAQEAKEARNWSTVVGKADAILVEDPAHSEAMLLKKEANGELVSLEQKHSLTQTVTQETEVKKTGENFTTTLAVGEKQVKLEMIYIDPGTFTMGSPSDELGRWANETQHTVSLTHPVTLTNGYQLRGYWLGKYEVTQAQYQLVMMGKNPSEFKGDNLPVERVTWNDATEFCARLTAQERAAGRLQAGYEYTLPTEAQWEYACRAGMTTALNSGKNLTSEKGSCRNLNEVGWYDKNSEKMTHPVGLKQANEWGLFDMHGNVWEWCKDWYDYDYYSNGPAENPTGPASASSRVLRGGSWSNDASRCRSARRSYSYPDGSNSNCGFRVALSLVK